MSRLLEVLGLRRPPASERPAELATIPIMDYSRFGRAYTELRAALAEYRLAQLGSIPHTESSLPPGFYEFWLDDDRFLEAMMAGVRAKSVLDFEPANPSEPSLLAITA